MAKPFDFGEPPYRWDEFERFVDWWIGPTDPHTRIAEFELAQLDLAPELQRWLHLWGNNCDPAGRSFPWHHQIWLPTPDHHLSNGLVVIGRLEGGDCPLVAIESTGASPAGYIEWGETGRNDRYGERWDRTHESVAETLIMLTMWSMAQLGPLEFGCDTSSASYLLEGTAETAPERYSLYLADDFLLAESHLHSGATRSRRPALATEPGT